MGHIYVPLQCNGVEMYGLFDTGAPCMVVVDSLFDRLELEKEDTTIQISFPNTSSQGSVLQGQNQFMYIWMI